MRGVWTLLIVGCAVLCLSMTAVAQKRGGDPKLAALKNPVPSNTASVTAGPRAVRQELPALPWLPRPRRWPARAEESESRRSDGRQVGSRLERRRDLHHHPQRRPAPMSEMKPMKGTLTPTQIWQVVNYIRSIGPAPPGKEVVRLILVGAPRVRRRRRLPGVRAQRAGALVRTGAARSEQRRLHDRPPDVRRRPRRLPGPPARPGAADRVPARHPRRQEDRLHGVLPRERDDRSGRRPAERADLHDLPQHDRHRPAAHPADHRDARERAWTSPGSACTATPRSRT